MIHKTVRLACPPPQAFVLFTDRITEWWPPERRHTKDPNSTISLLPSGRFFERDSAGHEVELGAVLAWEPPRRLLLDWYPGTDREHPTRVEIEFHPDGDATLLVLAHNATTASADLFPLRAPRYDASWEIVFAALAKAANGV